MPYFICPNCMEWSLDYDRREEARADRSRLQRCGFGFLFELMDDYYPRRPPGILACDRPGRVSRSAAASSS